MSRDRDFPDRAPPASAREASDIARGDWVDRLLPERARPFVRLTRLDRPIGIWLLLLPCWWSMALATPGWPAGDMLLLFAIGAALMRGAGCVVNDLVDRDIDRRVARTAARPLASGAVSVRAALALLAALLIAALVVLIQFNVFTIALAIASLPLVALYPFAKRVTNWPQVVLGLTFNWGALVGWSAVSGNISLPSLLLYAGGVFWTLGYDTIYAHQDKRDDAIIGVGSTAIRLGAATRPWLAGFYGAALALFLGAGALVSLGVAFYAGLLALAAHFAWQVFTLRIDEPADCLAKFRSNRIAGVIVFASIVGGQIVA